MPFIGFQDAGGLYDSTPVENLFIKEYLTRAPGDFVRVYLYGLMLCNRPSEEMDAERMARALGLSEDEVASAFRYWERQGAVVRISDRPPAYRYINLVGAMIAGGGEDASLYKYRDFNNRLQAACGTRLLKPGEFSRAYGWIEDLKLSEDAVLLLVASQIEARGRNCGFSGMDKVAASWAGQGVTDKASAEELLWREGKPYKAARSVLNHFNLKRNPTRDEADLAAKWLDEWGIGEDAIIAACRATTKIANPSFDYIDKVLSSHRGVKDRAGMASRLGEAEDSRSLAKELLASLGARNASPAKSDLEAYAGLRAMGFGHAGLIAIAGTLSSSGLRKMSDLEAEAGRIAKISAIDDDGVAALCAGIKERAARAADFLRAAGEGRAPTRDEGDRVCGLIGEYGGELVAYAAERSRGTDSPLRYAARLLEAWRAEGVADADSARARQASHRSLVGDAAPPRTTAAIGYEQHEYKPGDWDFIISDLSSPPEGGSDGQE